MLRTVLLLCLASSVLPAVPLAAQWETAQGGNGRRDGWVDAQGPERMRSGWTIGARTEMPLQPITADGKVFFAEVPDWMSANGAVLRCAELGTGRVLWSRTLPLFQGSHPTPKAYRDGVVYAMPTAPFLVEDYLFALDATSGAILWKSARHFQANFYSSPLFLPNGDLLTTGEYVPARGWRMMRLDRRDGSVVWIAAAGDGPNPEFAGGALFQDHYYIVHESGGQHHVARIDVDTGFRLYTSPLQGAVGSAQAHENLTIGRDGTILWPQGSSLTGGANLIALRDTGSALVELWRTPIGDSWASNVGVGPDGTIYCCSPADEVQRLDPLTGAVLARSAPLSFQVFLSNFALDASGRVFGVFQAQGAVPGRLQAFAPDLRPLWGLELGPAPNAGPTLAGDGTLIVSTGHEVVRTFRPARLEVGPCFETASVTVRNGSGLNPLCFHSSDAPRPGETWRTTVDTTVHPGPTFFGAAFYLRPSSGVVVNAGEILVDSGSPRVGLVVLPVHTALETLSFDLPARPELCGRSMTGQAFLLGAGQLLLGNALDLTIGE